MLLLRAVARLVLLSLVQATCPPDAIYESLFQKCYKFINSSSSFLLSEKQCNSFGATLVSIQNGFENSYVSGLVAASTHIPSFWIGASLLVSSQWSWTANASLSYANWAESQPSDPSAYQCAAVRSRDNFWTKEMCNTEKPFVCSMSPGDSVPSTLPPPTCPPPQPTCPIICPSTATCSPDYKLFTVDCKCYKFDASWRTYSESIRFCAWDNATLPIIVSPEQNDFLVEITGHNYCEDGGCPWIGLQCSDKIAANCRWLDGETIASYNNFIPGQPDGDSKETFMYLYNPVGKWATPPNPGGDGPTFCQKAGTGQQCKKIKATDSRGSRYSPCEMTYSHVLYLFLLRLLVASRVKDDGIVNFRLLSLEDAKSLRALNEATHPGIAQSEEYWKDLLSSVGVPSNVGAFNRKKELIGAVTTIPDLILSSTGKKMAHPEELLLLQSHRKVAYISHLMVADSMRRRGIATQLMRKIMEKLRDAGAEALCLHTHTGNTAAVRLYEKLGFQNEARYTPDRDSNAMFFVYRIKP